MKTLYLIGGPMGVGKSTVCQRLKVELDKAVFLDGDHCWDAHPFQVTEETKAMVVDNICHLLGNFLRCSAYQSVIFCWVMHQQAILDDILSRLDLEGCRVLPISLTCRPEALRARLEGDVKAGFRQGDVVDRALGYLPLYDELDTIHLDTTGLSPDQVAAAIRAL